jgi:hypothetical protein
MIPYGAKLHGTGSFIERAPGLTRRTMSTWDRDWVVIAVLSAMLAACAPTPPPSQPVVPRAEDTARAAYEMQERCGRTGREWFKQFFGDGASRSGDSQSNSSYENHYNARLNGCFALQSAISITRDPKTGSTHTSSSKTLVDVNQNSDVGTFFTFLNPPPLTQCHFAGKACQSEAEWDALAKQYMER